MIKITKDTLVMIPGFDKELNLEELAQALAIVKENNAPRYQLPLGWDSTLGTSLRMAWNIQTQEFVVDGYIDEYGDPSLKFIFTQSEREEIMETAVMSDERRAFIESIWDEV